MKILSDPQLKKIIRLAIKEDLGKLGDITSNTVLTKQDSATFHFVSREKGILCGINRAKIVFELIDEKIKLLHSKKMVIQ